MSNTITLSADGKTLTLKIVDDGLGETIANETTLKDGDVISTSITIDKPIQKTVDPARLRNWTVISQSGGVLIATANV